MPERVWWPVLEVDQNSPRLFDIVTKDHAEDLFIGDRVILVTLDYADGSNNDGVLVRHLDFGWATWGYITDIQPTNSDPNLFIVYVEYDDKHSVSE